MLPRTTSSRLTHSQNSDGSYAAPELLKLATTARARKFYDTQLPVMADKFGFTEEELAFANPDAVGIVMRACMKEWGRQSPDTAMSDDLIDLNVKIAVQELEKKSKSVFARSNAKEEV